MFHRWYILRAIIFIILVNAHCFVDAMESCGPVLKKQKTDSKTITVITPDGTEFCLGTKLSDQIPYLRTLLNIQYRESTTKEITFETISATSLKLILHLLQGLDVSKKFLNDLCRYPSNKVEQVIDNLTLSLDYLSAGDRYSNVYAVPIASFLRLLNQNPLFHKIKKNLFSANELDSMSLERMNLDIRNNVVEYAYFFEMLAKSAIGKRSISLNSYHKRIQKKYLEQLKTFCSIDQLEAVQKIIEQHSK